MLLMRRAIRRSDVGEAKEHHYHLLCTCFIIFLERTQVVVLQIAATDFALISNILLQVKVICNMYYFLRR